MTLSVATLVPVSVTVPIITVVVPNVRRNVTVPVVGLPAEPALVVVIVATKVAVLPYGMGVTGLTTVCVVASETV